VSSSSGADLRARVRLSVVDLLERPAPRAGARSPLLPGLAAWVLAVVAAVLLARRRPASGIAIVVGGIAFLVVPCS
jgi:hypothetical protein